MTPDPEEWADIEGALRTYLRADPDVQAFCSQRVFFGAPRNSKDSFPFIMITRIGGGEQSRTDVPLDLANIQFDVYAPKADEANGGKATATQGAKVLRKVMRKLRGRTEIVPGVVVWDPRVTIEFYAPLPGDDRPRSILMVIIPNIVTEVVE